MLPCDRSNKVSGIVVLQPADVLRVCMTCGLFHPTQTTCPVASVLAARGTGRELATSSILGGRFEVLAVVH